MVVRWSTPSTLLVNFFRGLSRGFTWFIAEICQNWVFLKFYIIFDVKTVKCTHPPRNEVELQPNLIEFWVCHSSRKAYQIPVIKNVETSEFNACFHQCKTTCLKPEAPERISQECINIQLTFFFEKRCLIICQSALIFSVLGFRSSLVLELSLQTVRAVQVIAA